MDISIYGKNLLFLLYLCLFDLILVFIYCSDFDYFYIFYIFYYTFYIFIFLIYNIIEYLALLKR